MRVEIIGPVQTKHITSSKGEFTFNEQEAALHIDGQKYPLVFTLSLPDDQPKGFKVGEYFGIGGQSFTVEKGRLSLRRNLELVSA
tara:strand:- start:746 stop:1000 length:255 start_codon:yes stop_codon:yes gene_type:complete